MAKEKKNNGGSGGDGGAPAEVHAPEAQGLAEPSRATSGDAAPESQPEQAQGAPQDIPPDAQGPAAETQDAPAAPTVDIEAVQQRFAARLPKLFDLRAKLAAIEEAHEADGTIIAESVFAAVKGTRASAVITIGGVIWKAKHDAEKHGGRARLHELIKGAPVVLKNTGPAA